MNINKHTLLLLSLSLICINLSTAHAECDSCTSCPTPSILESLKCDYTNGECNECTVVTDVGRVFLIIVLPVVICVCLCIGYLIVKYRKKQVAYAEITLDAPLSNDNNFTYVPPSYSLDNSITHLYGAPTTPGQTYIPVNNMNIPNHLYSNSNNVQSLKD
jgi:hypothetical protein